jgi:hypothetical protein
MMGFGIISLKLIRILASSTILNHHKKLDFTGESLIVIAAFSV